MNTQTTLEKLDEKVTNILDRYNSLKNENSILQSELTSLKAEKELKDQQVSKLEDENAMKELEMEEIVNKIEGLLG